MVLYLHMFYAIFKFYAEVKFVSLDDGKTTNDNQNHQRNAIIKYQRFVSDFVPPKLIRSKMNFRVVYSVAKNYMIYLFFLK